MYKRLIFDKIFNRLKESRHFIQVLSGPRQVGKTTLALQLKEALPCPSHYASADQPTLKDNVWIEQQWEIGRLRAKEGNELGGLLILDEVQKIPHWSEVVKRLWDEDSSQDLNLKVMILGSSALLVHKSLTESLTGRFELVPITHWLYTECREAFDWNLEQYIYFGGYPGAAVLIEDEVRWSRYVIDSLIETSISRDIMLMARIQKPALLRRVFELGCSYSGQILSYQKMLGQLQDAGNASTIAHYLELLGGAGLVMGLSKFSFEHVRQKASSPKLQVLNTALISAQGTLTFKQAQMDREYWGRLVESAIGAHMINSSIGTKVEVSYWREGNLEVDFILCRGEELVAIEVKSGQKRMSLPGLEAFSKRFYPKKILLVGGQGIPIEEFLLKPSSEWL